MPQKILLYAPGFPGEAIPREPRETRVIDIISEIAQQEEINFETISYPGISDERPFTFENTKLQVFEVIKNKINQDYSVTLVGQSWGGLISLLALDQYKLDKLLLITPFLLDLPRDEITSILKMYSQEFPNLIPQNSIEKNANEIQAILNSFINTLQKDNNQTDIKILANIEDEIVPINLLNNLFSTSNIFKSKMTLTTLSNDHDFSHGKNELRTWLKNNV